MNICDIDPNFKLGNLIDESEFEFYDIENTPFKISGVFKENEKFRRMPEKVALNVSEGVYALHTNTAGGRIRFKTDSRQVILYALYDEITLMPHFTTCGSAGFDVYTKKASEHRYMGTFVPPYNFEKSFEGKVDLCGNEMREVIINMPLYSSPKKIYVGLEKKAEIKAADDYKDKPIVYYGSSITQGGCASRPGMAYQAIISRYFDSDFINLGFSGNAKGEDAISDYIKNLDMKMFVMDYDHNSPSAQHLNDTHEKMFKKIRESNPDIPIIIMSRPRHFLDDREKQRLEIIRKTYVNAVSSGDSNVYFIDGRELMGKDVMDNGTVDCLHPNDAGFMSMANKIIAVMENIF